MWTFAPRGSDRLTLEEGANYLYLEWGRGCAGAKSPTSEFSQDRLIPNARGRRLRTANTPVLEIDKSTFMLLQKTFNNWQLTSDNYMINQMSVHFHKIRKMTVTVRPNMCHKYAELSQEKTRKWQNMTNDKLHFLKSVNVTQEGIGNPKFKHCSFWDCHKAYACRVTVVIICP